jgi:hypothetical protein
MEVIERHAADFKAISLSKF